MHIRQQLKHLNVKECIPELLERVSARKLWEAAGQSIWRQASYRSVFSFVMVYNNKKIGAICRCNITFRVQNYYL